VVDTFGLEYYMNPRKVLEEMKRVCKKDGTILLLNMGNPENEFLQKYYRFTLPHYLLTHGFFPHRPWDRIVKSMDFEVIQSKKMQGGTLYYQILRNKKEEREVQERSEKRKKFLGLF
jgi:ubiquinone/menaquinone biosynthesis C-methylase UbiE